MSNEQPCKACEDLASFGLGKCLIHGLGPVLSFDITEDMAKNDKYGEAVVLSDRADKDVDISLQAVVRSTQYFDNNPKPAYPVALRPEPNYPKA